MSAIRALIARLFRHQRQGKLLTGWSMCFQPITCPDFQKMMPMLPPELQREAAKGNGVILMSRGKKTVFVVLSSCHRYVGCQN